MDWEFLQNAFARFLIKRLDCKYIREYKDAHFYTFNEKDHSWFSGCSLGRYIILPSWCAYENPYVEWIIKHEYGHCVQSHILVIFYLLIVGVPSIINNILARFIPWFSKNYYNLYPEKWANKLGGNDETEC